VVGNAADVSAGPSIPRAEESLRVAVLLTLSGGFLDAFTWLAHGNVLANTQSANVVLLGVYTALGKWPEAFRHIPPIVAFVLGAFTAAWLRAHAHDAGRRVSLLLEIALLFAVMVLHEQLPSTGVTLLISFAAAVQTRQSASFHGGIFRRAVRPCAATCVSGGARLCDDLHDLRAGRHDRRIRNQSSERRSSSRGPGLAASHCAVGLRGQRACVIAS
jgi:hypothetical protein